MARKEWLDVVFCLSGEGRVKHKSTFWALLKTLFNILGITIRLNLNLRRPLKMQNSVDNTYLKKFWGQTRGNNNQKARF